MKLNKLSIAIAAITLGASVMAGCGEKSTWEKYEDWRNTNIDFYQQMTTLSDGNGGLFYRQLKPSWNPGSGVLIHYFNDRSLTEGNLSPMETSTVAVKYHLSLCNGEPVDSSYSMTDSLFTTPLNQVIAGWQVALNDMRVGDSCRIVVPATEGYGATGSTSVLPYSVLVFDIKLVDIPYYEIPQP